MPPPPDDAGSCSAGWSWPPARSACSPGATRHYGDVIARTMGVTTFALFRLFSSLETADEDESLFSGTILSNQPLADRDGALRADDHPRDRARLPPADPRDREPDGRPVGRLHPGEPVAHRRRGGQEAAQDPDRSTSPSSRRRRLWPPRPDPMSAAIRQLAAPWQETILPLAERLGAAPVVEVRADDPWSEAGRKVLAGHLGRVLARAPGVVSGEDPEEVHAMRVATRRMRAAMRVFGGAYDRRVTRAHLDDLRLLGGRLGVVRDLDVWLGLLADDARRRSKRDRAGLRVLTAAWEADRTARHADLAAVITSSWFADVATGLAAFVETPGAGGPDRRAADPEPRPRPRPVRAVGGLPGGLGLRRPTSSWSTSPPCTSCGSRPSGCATRSSSCASRSARRRPT